MRAHPAARPARDAARGRRAPRWYRPVNPSVYGRTSFGNLRATFILDEDGVVRHVIPKVSPKTHDDVVLAALAELPAAR